MKDLLLFLLTLWIVTAAGRTLLQRVCPGGGLPRLERALFSLALGLGLLAYGMLALGLAGGLYPVAGGGLLLVLVAAGFPAHGPMLQALRAGFSRGVHLPFRGWAVAAIFLLLVGIPLVGVWTPPTAGLEWDSLSYHLADPKMYLQAHRIYPLPWESHSNFAFTSEMWFLFGLMESGVPLAKLFHLACGVGVCLGVSALGARLFSARAGLLAALIFASTPLALWEAGTAYTDLAGTFLATLTLLAVAGGAGERDARRFWLAAILMGLTLSTKATALGTLALLALGLLVWRLRVLRQRPAPALGQMALWCLLALAVGSPWFIKSVVTTGNPVYPFFYSVFGGRGFNADLARAYDVSNANFGVSYEPKGAETRLVHTPDMAVLAPWNLTFYLLPGVPRPNPNFRAFNDFQLPLVVLSPLLLAALFFPAFGARAPVAAKALGAFALLSTGLWFATSQQVRYLLPLLPVLCLLTAWVLERAWKDRGVSGYALGVLGAASVLFALGTGYGPSGLVAREAPVVFGQVSRGAYLSRDISGYDAMQFLNRTLPPGTKVVFYGNPLGFYCDKPYLWGDPNHSTVIPYDTFHSAENLRAFLQKLGVTHILINRRFFQPAPGTSDWSGWVGALTEGSGPPVFDSHGVAVYALPPGKR